MATTKRWDYTRPLNDVEKGEAAPSRGRPRSRSLDRKSERRNSFGRAREIIRLGERDHSAASLFDENHEKRDRAEQRRKMMAYLTKGSNDPPRKRSMTSFFGLPKQAQNGSSTGKQPIGEANKVEHVGEEGVRLLGLADEYQSSRAFHFNRFERLCILDILHSQHSLIKIDEEIQYIRKGDLSDETANRLHLRIQIYSQKLNWPPACCAANVLFHRRSNPSFPKALYFKADGLPN